MFRRRRNLSEGDLEDEIQAHLALEIQERVTSGETEEDAARAARRTFGNIALVKDRTRDVWRRVWLESFVQDLRVACRFLLKRRSATAAMILTLAIAVGSSTIAIGAVDHSLWRSVAPGGGSLVAIYNSRATAQQFAALSYGDYAMLRDRLRDAVDLAAFNAQRFTLEGIAQPTQIWGDVVSDNYFRVLDATALMGRLIGDPDTRDAPVAVLSYDAWRNRFASDPQIVGKALRTGLVRLTIIGVAVPGVHDPQHPSEFWAPISMTKALMGDDPVANDLRFLQVIARPHPGVTRQQIQTYIQGLSTETSRDGWRLTAVPGAYLRFWIGYREVVAQFLGIFAALTIGILIIACANIAGLLMARSAERTRELAIRQALGGTRAQLVRRLVAESLLVTAVGGAAGVLLAWWSAPLFRRMPLPQWQEVTLTFDWRLVGIAVVISLAASVLFTTVTAWKGLRVDVQQALVSSSRGFTGKALGQRALVVAQLAIGCVMAAAAMLLLRSLWNVQHVDLGFDATNRVAAQIVLSSRGYTDSQAQTFYQRLQEALAQRPEVEGVALEFHPVLGRMRTQGHFTLPGAPQAFLARYNRVSAGYFQTMDIPLAAGRAFDDRDSGVSEPVAIVNQTLARQLNGDPIGQVLRPVGAEWGHRSGTTLRIVGVVGDVPYNGITEPPQPYVYLPVRQGTWITDYDVYVRSRLPPAEAIALMRSAVHGLDPELPLNDVGTLTDRVTAAEIVPRSSAIVSTLLAAIAVFLALAGVYAMMTTSIENRRRELAIRSALGASPSRLAQRVVSEGASLTVVACVIGIGGSLAAARAIADLLFGVRVHDPISLSAAVGLVIIASGVAWIAPSRRAASLDPIEVLRAE